MMPQISHTQVLLPTQPTLVATSLPGTNALRPAYDAVAPSVSNPSVSNNSKGTGGYAGSASAPAPSPVVPLLSTPMPASFSTSSASLNASAMFATQALAQDSGSAETIFATYDQLVAASLVKYAPSNAALPQPEALNLFAKLLNEQKTSNTPMAAVAMQQATKEAAISAPSQAALQQVVPTPKAAVPKEAPRSSSLARSEITFAASAYRATSTRNQIELSDDKVDAISG
jgi:hypothetical protein